MQPSAIPGDTWGDFEAVQELKAESCPACSRPKKRMQAFCRRCYFSLDAKDRSDLYQRIEDGFAEIYRVAIDKLRARGKDVDPSQLAEIEKRLLALARAGEITTEAMHQAGREFRRELRRIGTLTPGGIERRIKRLLRAKAEVCPRCNGYKTAAAKACARCRRKASHAAL